MLLKLMKCLHFYINDFALSDFKESQMIDNAVVPRVR